MNTKNIKKEKGISILLTILVMAAILSIVFGISRISLVEIRLARDIPHSLIVYYAAEAGMEQALYDEIILGGASDISCPLQSPQLLNKSSYGIKVNRQGDNLTIQSVGCYGDVRRAIETTFK